MYRSFIAGGTTEQSVKGKVASVEFAADAFSNNTLVTNMRIVNLDLETAAATEVFAGMLPGSQLTALSLTNTLLAAMPANLKSLKQLMTLYVAFVRQGLQSCDCGLTHCAV